MASLVTALRVMLAARLMALSTGIQMLDGSAPRPGGFFADMYEVVPAKEVTSGALFLRKHTKPERRRASMPLGDPDPLKEGPSFSQGWRNRMLVAPEYKFALCFIDQNADHEMNTIMNKLNGIDGDEGSHMMQSRPSHTKLFLQFFHNCSEGEDGQLPSCATRENGWRFGIFVRDPAERFLSAWLENCDTGEEWGSCFGDERTSKMSHADKVKTFRRNVRKFLKRYMAARKENGSLNANYDQQTTFCGGRPLSEYDFVGNLSTSKAGVGEQMANMLHKIAKVPEDHAVWAEVPKLFNPYQEAEEAERHLPSASLLMSQYYDFKTYKRVTLAYSKDYHALPFTPNLYDLSGEHGAAGSPPDIDDDDHDAGAAPEPQPAEPTPDPPDQAAESLALLRAAWGGPAAGA